MGMLVTFAVVCMVTLGLCAFAAVFVVPTASYMTWLQEREIKHLPTEGYYTGTLSICHVEHPQSGGSTYLTFIDGREFTINNIYELQSGQNYTVTYSLYNTNYASEVKLAK